MDDMNLNTAVEALRKRERIPKSASNKIGRWSIGEEAPSDIPDLPKWASSRRIESVIWTALGPQFGGDDGKVPTVEEAVQYLSSLSGKKREDAKKYIRYAPVQINTNYRRRFEAELGWSPIQCLKAL